MNDLRIKEMMENLRKVHRLSNSEGGTPETQKLNRETFKSVIQPNIVLISKAFRHQFVVPDFLNCLYSNLHLHLLWIFSLIDKKFLFFFKQKLQKTSKIFIGSARVMQMEKWLRIFHNWLE